MAETLIWISGATQGIGLGLARQAPWADSTIINISRRPHPDYESVVTDLSDPQSWPIVGADFARRLDGFQGDRAIFIHNAYVEAIGKVGEVDPEAYSRALVANCAAALALGNHFIRACGTGYESGLVLMSSDAAAIPMPGMASYCAAKAAAESWVEVVRREREASGKGPWVVAVRPGAVITPPVEAAAALPESIYPAAARVRASLATRVDIDEAGRRIWAALPPAPGVSVISFGRTPQPGERFADVRVDMRNG